MKRACLVGFLALAACATEYHARPAEKPLNARELGSRDLTVVDSGADPSLADAFAQALESDGFKVVAHPAYHGELEVTLTTERTRQGQVAVATLRSDGFFVEEARAPLDRNDATAAWLAKTLAVSSGMADFVRNNGTPQQAPFSPD